MRTATIAFLLGMTVVMAGCTAWATYPSIEGTVDLSSPELEPIPTLMAMSVTYMAEAREHEGMIIFDLPEGTPERVWRRVGRKIGPRGQPQMSKDEPAYHVVTVRVRAFEGEVDLIQPVHVGSAPGLTTLHFTKPLIGDWRVEDTRMWRYRVEVPEPSYPKLLAEKDREWAWREDGVEVPAGAQPAETAPAEAMEGTTAEAVPAEMAGEPPTG